MQSSLEKLRKFFRLEHSNGYANTAVIGGLANIFNFWEGEARNDAIPEDIIQAVGLTLRGYADLSPEARAESLKAVWKQIVEKFPEAVQAKKQTVVHAPKPPVETVESQPEEIPPVSEMQEKGPEPKPASAPRPVKVPGRAETRPGGVTSKRPIALNAALTVLAGVGPRHAAMLTRLGMNTLGDMLYYFPRRYDDYSQLKPIHELFYGQQVTVIGTVTMVTTRPLRGGKMSIVEAVINDGTAGLRLTWFNQPWVANRMKVDDAISVSGKVEQYLGSRSRSRTCTRTGSCRCIR
jgi:ATP-dependent DNA helicase RecG